MLHTFDVFGREAVALFMKKTFDIKVPCFCDTDLAPSQHYPKKCIGPPIRNGSAALILSPFKCNVFFFIIHISFCCPYNRPTP